MFSLESDKMSPLWPNDSLTFTFYMTFSNGIPNWSTIVKEAFDSMFSLGIDKMTALRQNDISPFTFYVIFSNITPNWTTFVK